MALKRVVVGLSGGVDSAVAAFLLKRKGFSVIGAYMQNWDLIDEKGNCSVVSDIEYAKEICKILDVEFCEVNFVKEYWNSVFSELLQEYEQGFTPNPDILCNKFIKFDKFVNYSMTKLNAEAVATGHYARNSLGPYLENPFQSAKLLQGVDSKKDQTFFLSQISQTSLRKAMFPLGELTKKEVKCIALQNSLGKIAKRKESMGMCFIGSRKFQSFISEYIKEEKGVFIDIDSGSVVGEHNGKHMWTLGQKCRLGGMSEPYYIARKSNSQEIYVAKGHNHPILYSSIIYTFEAHWISSEPVELTEGNIFKCKFRFQHSKPLTDCTVIKLNEQNLYVRLEKPLRALTPGQYAVFYKNEECLGSARIAYAGPSNYFLKDCIR